MNSLEGSLVLVPRYPFNTGTGRGSLSVRRILMQAALMPALVLRHDTTTGNIWLWSEFGRVTLNVNDAMDPVTLKPLTDYISVSTWADMLERSVAEGFIDRDAVLRASRMG